MSFIEKEGFDALSTDDEFRFDDLIGGAGGQAKLPDTQARPEETAVRRVIVSDLPADGIITLGAAQDSDAESAVEIAVPFFKSRRNKTTPALAMRERRALAVAQVQAQRRDCDGGQRPDRIIRTS